MHKCLTRQIFCAFALVAGVTSPVSVTWAVNLTYLNDLDLGVFGDVELVGDCYPGSFTLVDTPLRAGKSVKVFNDGAKPCVEPNGELKHRKEIRWGANNISFSNLNSPYWFGFSMFIPNDFPTKAQSPDPVIVAQWMGGAYGPELSFQIVGGEQMAVRRDWSTGIDDKGNEMTHAKLSIERGVWIDWVVYRERSWNNDGVLRIWKNGVKVVDFVGPTAINYVAHGGANKGNISFKTGIYWGTQPRDVKYTLYFDNIRTTNVADGYAAVLPGGASLATPVEPPTPTGLQLSVQ